MKCKKPEHLNYSAYGICGHAFAMSADSRSLNLFLQFLQKASFCLNFQTLEIQVAQEQRKATKECNQKIF